MPNPPDPNDLPADGALDDEEDVELDGLIQISQAHARAVPLIGEDDDGNEDEFLAVILVLTGSADDREVTHRFMVPDEYWDHLNSVGVRAILDYETDGASEAALGAANRDDAVEPDEEAWFEFTAALGEVLAVLEPGQFLILAAAGNRFVQIAVDDHEDRIETVCNQYLGADDRLSTDDLDRLAELGWEPPTHFPEDDPRCMEGSPNHFIDLPPGTDLSGVAGLLVETLRTVHRVAEPGELTYHSFDRDDAQILLPTLRIDRT